MTRLSYRRMLLGLAVAAAAVVGAGLAFAPRAASASLDTGVVDVTTNLAYQNGSAAGTGMVLTSSGDVLTNNHVIRGATTVRVVDPSTGRSYAATVVGYSVSSDIALLKIRGASHLRTVTLGDSSAVRVGQRVTAIGNAGGAGGKPSSATGTVTGLGRTIVASDGGGLSERLVGLIRTNAALEPGDSGGPLLNTAGRVIGIDTAASAGFQFQSLHDGYAIPINRALAIVRQIRAGRASATVHIGSTPFLGLSVAFAPSDQNGSGAGVAAVVPGSPAAQAGIVAGNTITTLDGQAVTSYAALTKLLLRHNAGDTVTLEWVDATGATQSASVRTAAGPPQ